MSAACCFSSCTSFMWRSQRPNPAARASHAAFLPCLPQRRIDQLLGEARGSLLALTRPPLSCAPLSWIILPRKRRRRKQVEHVNRVGAVDRRRALSGPMRVPTHALTECRTLCFSIHTLVHAAVPGKRRRSCRHGTMNVCHETAMAYPYAGFAALLHVLYCNEKKERKIDVRVASTITTERTRAWTEV